MSKNLEIRSAVHDYKVNFIDDVAVTLQEVLCEGDRVVIDANVLNLHKDRFGDILDDYNPIVIEALEKKKSYTEIEPVIQELIEGGFRKNNRLVAIGGGITQDIVTFIAANIYRRAEWIFFPTTLLAQGDSCIGGKASINFRGFKNLLGNFYPPNEIYIDLQFLTTLHQKEIVSGLGEMTHFFFVAGEYEYEIIRDVGAKAFEDRSVLEELIHISLQVKKATIEIDEFDQKERQVFNYGHSFGHAIESITDYRVPHGIAVSHGMDIANYISAKSGLIDMPLRDRLREVLVRYWDEVPLGEIDIDAFIGALRKDKKNVGKEVKVILTRGLGKMFKTTLDVDGQGREWIETWFRDEAWRGEKS
ncbi:MAG: AroB-related putative sugar phosphate phospholyase (cyclizing) [bacterium]